METVPAPVGTVKVAVACLPVVTPLEILNGRLDPTGQPFPSDTLSPRTTKFNVPAEAGTV